MNFGQVITAMVTPFQANGDIDWPATERLINHLLENGTEALVVAGTTGESPTLSAEEKKELFTFTVNVVAGRAPVIAGTGSNDTRDSVAMTRVAEQAGVDGVMLVTPYYNKPSQEGMYQHFRTIAETTHLPVMLYNIPGRSAVGMTPETIIRLAQVENITSVKEASGDLDAMAQIIYATPDSFQLYSGDDALALPVLSIGGAGVVSVAAHIAGNELQDMIRSFRLGDLARAASLHQRLLPLFKGLFAAPNPVPVKTALNLNGIDTGSVRLPMIPLDATELDTLQKLLAVTERSLIS